MRCIFVRVDYLTPSDRPESESDAARWVDAPGCGVKKQMCMKEKERVHARRPADGPRTQFTQR